MVASPSLLLLPLPLVRVILKESQLHCDHALKDAALRLIEQLKSFKMFLPQADGPGTIQQSAERYIALPAARCWDRVAPRYFLGSRRSLAITVFLLGLAGDVRVSIGSPGLGGYCCEFGYSG